MVVMRGRIVVMVPRSIVVVVAGSVDGDGDGGGGAVTGLLHSMQIRKTPPLQLRCNGSWGFLEQGRIADAIAKTAGPGSIKWASSDTI